MVYMVQGTTAELFSVFGQQHLLMGNMAVANPELELSEVRFLGSEKRTQSHAPKRSPELWQNKLIQANRTIARFPHLLGMVNPLIKEQESLSQYQEHYRQHHFVYMNELDELCGFVIMYRQDDPSQWMIGLINEIDNSQKSTVAILSGIDLRNYSSSNALAERTKTVSVTDNAFFGQIEFSFLKQWLQNRFNQDNLVQVDRIVFLLRQFIQNDKDLVLQDPIALSSINQQLMGAENKALNLIVRHQLPLSSAMFHECLNPESALAKEIMTFPFGKDEALNKLLLQMIIVFYEEKTLEQHRNLLKNQASLKPYVGFLWHDTQIKLLPFLLAKKYPFELIQTVCVTPGYFQAINSLRAMNLMQDVAIFFANPEKRKQWDYIINLKDEACRDLCLVFWVKGDLTENYRELVTALQKYPLLAKMLLDLDKTQTISINDLRMLVFDPKKHQQLTILHSFAAELKQNKLNGISLKPFKEKENELSAISQSLDVLKNLFIADESLQILKKAKCKRTHFYDLILRNDEKGRVLRLFLPQLVEVDDEEYRAVLANLLYVGVGNTVSQGEMALKITDPELSALAIDLHERFACVRQLQHLGFIEEMTDFAALPNSANAKRFRVILSKIGTVCKDLHERLRHSSSEEEKVRQWQDAEKTYRRLLFRVAYDAIMQPDIELKTRLKDAEQVILNIVDPQMTSWLQKFFIVIANIFITTFTLGIANDIKYRNTGNYWFFTQTKAGEKVRALNKEMLEFVESPQEDVHSP